MISCSHRWQLPRRCSRCDLSAATVVNDDRLQPFDQQPITTIRVIVGFEQPFELEEHWSQGHLPISLRGT